ncbi:MAG: type II secretion system major pseudopilin GspG, partial [Pseudomonadota bacterium]
SYSSSNSGVTILEILIVLAIIALISAVIGPRVTGYLGRAKSETAALQINQIDIALQLFYIDMGRYPAETEGLDALVTAQPGSVGWAGPYLDKSDAITDPWGRAYIYAVTGESEQPKVQTLGRDGVQGGVGEDKDIPQD